jgi:hypothetical protein
LLNAGCGYYFFQNRPEIGQKQANLAAPSNGVSPGLIQGQYQRQFEAQIEAQIEAQS